MLTSSSLVGNASQDVPVLGNSSLTFIKILQKIEVNNATVLRTEEYLRPSTLWSQVAHYPTSIPKYHCPSWLRFIRVALHRLYGPSQYITPLTYVQAALARPFIVKMPVT